MIKADNALIRETWKYVFQFKLQMETFLKIYFRYDYENYAYELYQGFFPSEESLPREHIVNLRLVLETN